MTLVKGLILGSVVVALLPVGLLSARATHTKARQESTQTAPTSVSTDIPVVTPPMTEGFASIQIAAAIPVKAVSTKATVKTTAASPVKRHTIWRAPAKTAPRSATTEKTSKESTDAATKMTDDNPYPRPAAPKMTDDRPFGAGS